MAFLNFKFRPNMQTNCVPEEVFNMEEKDYHNFLDKRRKLMAKKIRK